MQEESFYTNGQTESDATVSTKVQGNFVLFKRILCNIVSLNKNVYPRFTQHFLLIYDSTNGNNPELLNLKVVPWRETWIPTSYKKVPARTGGKKELKRQYLNVIVQLSHYCNYSFRLPWRLRLIKDQAISILSFVRRYNLLAPW